jgi:putative transposase
VCPVLRTLSPEINETLTLRWEPIYRCQLHYLLTWSTRGRRPGLKERHAQTINELMHQIAAERGYSVLAVTTGSDHVHVLLAIRPAQSIAGVVRELKGRTGVELLTRYPELRVWLRGNLSWDERYAVETVSAARLDRVRDRLLALHSAHGQFARAS